MVAAMFGVGLLGFSLRRKKYFKRLTLMSLYLSVCGGAVLGLSSCSSKQLGAAPVLTTPAGSYSVRVTAKQTGSKVVPGSQPGTTVTVYGNQNQMSIPYTVNVVVN